MFIESPKKEEISIGKLNALEKTYRNIMVLLYARKKALLHC